MASPSKSRTANAPTADAESELARFIAKFAPERQALIRSVRAVMQRRLPSAIEMAYDNYNFFVIGYSPTTRPSDAVVSIAAGASGVSLCFVHGARLPDPDGLLQGAGKQTRFVRLPSADTLAEPGIASLLAAAIARAPVAFDDRQPGTLVIRSVSAKQRPRQRAGAAKKTTRKVAKKTVSKATKKTRHEHSNT